MSAVLERCRLAGLRLWMEGPDLRYDAPKGAMTPDLIAELKNHKPALLAALTQEDKLDAILAEACQGVEGITPSQFRSLLSAEDVTDILAGDIPSVPTLRAYAASFAKGIADGRITVLGTVAASAARVRA